MRAQWMRQGFYGSHPLTVNGSEGKVQAYILINTESAKLWEVADECKKIQGVKEAHAVTGQFDVVVYAEFAKMEDLGALIDEAQSLEGVRRSQTLIAIPPTIRE